VSLCGYAITTRPDATRPFAVDIDVMLARRKMSVGELAGRVGITPANLAVLKNGRAKAVRFATLAALCEALNCQPGDLLRWEAGDTAGQ
jgi:putative transcriptional regulator